MTDLRQRVPAHSLVEKLMKEFEASRIRVDPDSGRVVIDDESLSWFQGVLGERRVADRLDHLGDEFTVLHSVPFRKRDGDIDHIVVSPSGVTIINTKHSPGRQVWSAGYGIYVGGQERKSFIVNLAESVREAERRLSAVVGVAVPVRGVLCFVDPAAREGGRVQPSARRPHAGPTPRTSTRCRRRERAARARPARTVRRDDAGAGWALGRLRVTSGDWGSDTNWDGSCFRR